MSRMNPAMRVAFQRRDMELDRCLQKPRRKKLEDEFERDHCRDTDEELLQYLVERYLVYGENMQRSGTVGIRYLEQRLGRWNSFMTRVKRAAKEEKEGSGLEK